MKYSVITIGREFCTGGLDIAREVARRLGGPMYDKELITLAAKESGLSEQAIAAGEKRPSGSLLYNLYTMGSDLPLSDQVFVVQSQIIRGLADKGPCVIVGRCGDYVLRGRTDVLRVFLHAPLEFRRRRAQAEGAVPADADERTANALLERRTAAAPPTITFTASTAGARPGTTTCASTPPWATRSARTLSCGRRKAETTPFPAALRRGMIYGNGGCTMIKTVGVVSLSAGTLGEDFVRHELELGVRRLEHYGLKVRFLPHALKGIDYLKAHPEARAADLLEAFRDPEIDLILCAIGGDDAYRLLPYLFDEGRLERLPAENPSWAFPIPPSTTSCCTRSACPPFTASPFCRTCARWTKRCCPTPGGILRSCCAPAPSGR